MDASYHQGTTRTRNDDMRTLKIKNPTIFSVLLVVAL